MKAMTGGIAIVATAASLSAYAADVCDPILQDGIWQHFEKSSNAVESQEFANWVCTNRSEDIGHAGGYSLIWENNHYKMSKEDCSRQSGSFHLSKGFKEQMRTVAPEIVKAWLDCKLKWLEDHRFQSLALLEYTDDPRRFVIYFLIGRGMNKDRAVLKISSSPKVSCDKTTIDFTREANVICNREHETDSVLVSVQFKTGNVALLTMRALAVPPRSLKLAEKIKAGSMFSISFGVLPDGHVGTIQANKAYTGTYNPATMGWKISGPNQGPGIALHDATVEYCVKGRPGCQAYGDCTTVKGHEAGCGAVVEATGDPSNHELSLWNIRFKFDENGNVSYNGTNVGLLTVH